jgi:exonuclease VII large subunit
MSLKYILRSNLPLEDIYKTKNQIDTYKSTIRNTAINYINEHYFNLKIMNEKLNAFDYNKHLEKGFALVSDINGNIIKDKEQLNINDILRIRFKDFEAEAETINIKEV